MNSKPESENHLEHLFFSKESFEIHKCTYLGPTHDPVGNKETSPDCLILDQRTIPYKTLRCEFKWHPKNKNCFRHNGNFDIAVIWTLDELEGSSPEDFKQELKKYNGCTEVIVLDEKPYFKNLPDYTKYSAEQAVKLANEKALANKETSESLVCKSLSNYARKKDTHTVFALCLAAELYPKMYFRNKMIDLLVDRFSTVEKMTIRERSGLLTGFPQMTPLFVAHMQGNKYGWVNKEISQERALDILKKALSQRHNIEPPTKDDCKAVCVDNSIIEKPDLAVQNPSSEEIEELKNMFKNMREKFEELGWF